MPTARCSSQHSPSSPPRTFRKRLAVEEDAGRPRSPGAGAALTTDVSSDTRGLAPSPRVVSPRSSPRRNARRDQLADALSATQMIHSGNSSPPDWAAFRQRSARACETSSRRRSSLLSSSEGSVARSLARRSLRDQSSFLRTIEPRLLLAGGQRSDLGMVREAEAVPPAGHLEAPCNPRVVAKGLVAEAGDRDRFAVALAVAVLSKCGPVREPPRGRISDAADPLADRAPTIEREVRRQPHRQSGEGLLRADVERQLDCPGSLARVGLRLPVLRIVVGKPRIEEVLDVLAAVQALEAPAHAAALYDDERRDAARTQLPGEIGPIDGVDALQEERAVVLTALQHLGQEALGAPGRPRRRRVDEAEHRLRFGGLGPPARPTSGRSSVLFDRRHSQPPRFCPDRAAIVIRRRRSGNGIADRGACLLP